MNGSRFCDDPATLFGLEATLVATFVVAAAAVFLLVFFVAVVFAFALLVVAEVPAAGAWEFAGEAGADVCAHTALLATTSINNPVRTFMFASYFVPGFVGAGLGAVS